MHIIIQTGHLIISTILPTAAVTSNAGKMKCLRRNTGGCTWVRTSKTGIKLSSTLHKYQAKVGGPTNNITLNEDSCAASPRYAPFQVTYDG